MRVLKFVATIIVLGAWASSASALTPQQIAAGFVDANEICLEASLKGVSVNDLPKDFKQRISKGNESARFMAAGNATGPIWDVLSAQGNVLISETSEQSCEVISFGPPVDKTLKAAIKSILKRQPDFKDAGDKPDDYTPIRYGLVREENGQNLHIVLSGAEPGSVPGRYFRFSMLGARFERSDKPATQ